MSIVITDANFKQEVLESEVPVIVDFGATWCGPCRMITPIMEQISEAYAGKAKVGKADVDECSELTMTYGVRNVPTVLFFKNGEVVGKMVGAASKEKFEEELNKHL